MKYFWTLISICLFLSNLYLTTSVNLNNQYISSQIIDNIAPKANKTDPIPDNNQNRVDFKEIVDNFDKEKKDTIKIINKRNSMKKGLLRTNSQNSMELNTYYKILKLDSTLQISSEKIYTQVNDVVNFGFYNGSFSSVIRKISLAGSIDMVHSFNVMSKDVKIKDTRIISNCLDENRSPKQAYVCVISIFEEIQVFGDKVVEINYSYTAQGTVRLDKGKQKNANAIANENVIQIIVDNYKRLQSVDNIKINLHFNELLDKKDITTTVGSAVDIVNNRTVINIEPFNLSADDSEEIEVRLPLFVNNARKLVNVV